MDERYYYSETISDGFIGSVDHSIKKVRLKITDSLSSQIPPRVMFTLCKKTDGLFWRPFHFEKCNESIFICVLINTLDFLYWDSRSYDLDLPRHFLVFQWASRRKSKRRLESFDCDKLIHLMAAKSVMISIVHPSPDLGDVFFCFQRCIDWLDWLLIDIILILLCCK